LEYIAEHDILNHQVEYCFYLDIDNVIYHPIQHLFNDYFFHFPTPYQQEIENDTNRFMTHFYVHHEANNTILSGTHTSNKTTATSFIEYDHIKPRLQFVSMWRDIIQQTMWQSGQILYHRRYSQGCMDIWRAQIDSEDHYGAFMEQPLLVKALQHQYHDLLGVSTISSHHHHHHHNITYNPNNIKPTNHPSKFLCHVIELPDQPRHFDMAKNNIVSGKTGEVPTILHFSHARVVSNNAQEQRNSFAQALHLRFQTVRVNRTLTTKVAVTKENGSKHLVSRNNTLIPWDTIITPISTYGIGKNK
jgi:hypothetical protein